MGKPNISAGEVGRFLYCPKQWYYIRTYGEANLKAMHREKNPHSTGCNPHFERGRKFHASYERRENARRVLAWCVVALVLAGAAVAAVFLWRGLL